MIPAEMGFLRFLQLRRSLSCKPREKNFQEGSRVVTLQGDKMEYFQISESGSQKKIGYCTQ